MIVTIAVIAVIDVKKESSAIIWKPLSSDRSDRSDNDRWDRKRSISVIVVATTAEKWFPYDRYDHCNRWTIAAIIAIIWKPGFK